MPELPEVETIIKYLRPRIRNKRILGIKVLGARVTRYHQNFNAVRRKLIGRRIENISRHGKNIIFELSGGANLVMHLMMTGRPLLNPKEKSPYDRLVLNLSGGDKLVFNDIRQFGWCRIIIPGGWTSTAKRSALNAGHDALSLDFGTFKSLVAGRNAIIKNLLLNQKIISGIGNIYADEILWHAGIRPTRKADSLTHREIKKLFSSMRHILWLAIKKEGTSSRDYRKPDGTEGGYYKIRKAYQREGEKCSRDGAIIRRIKIGARSSYFCPKHQN